MARVLLIGLQVVLGVLLAGLVLGLLVPVAGETVGPGVAVGITVLSVAFVLLVGQLIERWQRQGGPMP